MNKQFYESNIAFSAVLLCLKYIDDVARKENKETQKIAHLLHTIINNNIQSTAELYQKVDLKEGFELFLNQLDYHTVKNNFIIRYLFGILSLERKLMTNDVAIQQLMQHIEQFNHKLQYHDILDESMITSLASVYVDIVSPLSNKIHIVGEPDLIKIPYNQKLIRALLLCAVRSAVLWRQIGGRKRHFLFCRKKIITTLKEQIKTYRFVE